MALTITEKNKVNFGSVNAAVGTILFDSSYPTGGESITAANLGFGALIFLYVFPFGGLLFEWDDDNAKVLAYEQGFRTGSTAAADSTQGVFIEDITATETVLKIMGNSAAIDTTYRIGILRECANATDLSSIVTAAWYIAIGV